MQVLGDTYFVVCESWLEGDLTLGHCYSLVELRYGFLQVVYIQVSVDASVLEPDGVLVDVWLEVCAKAYED